MDTFHLAILSPQRTFYSGDCRSLVVPISDGMFGIMAGHTPLTAAIQDGEVSFTKGDGTKVTCVVTSGMVDVNRKEVRLLCESALSPDEIDEEMEKRKRDEALLEMKKKQGAQDFALWQMTFQRAMVRLKTKNKET